MSMNKWEKVRYLYYIFSIVALFYTNFPMRWYKNYISIHYVKDTLKAKLFKKITRYNVDNLC